MSSSWSGLRTSPDARRHGPLRGQRRTWQVRRRELEQANGRIDPGACALAGLRGCGLQSGRPAIPDGQRKARARAALECAFAHSGRHCQAPTRVGSSAGERGAGRGALQNFGGAESQNHVVNLRYRTRIHKVTTILHCQRQDVNSCISCIRAHSLGNAHLLRLRSQCKKFPIGRQWHQRLVTIR